MCKNGSASISKRGEGTQRSGIGESGVGQNMLPCEGRGLLAVLNNKPNKLHPPTSVLERAARVMYTTVTTTAKGILTIPNTTTIQQNVLHRGIQLPYEHLPYDAKLQKHA